MAKAVRPRIPPPSQAEYEDGGRFPPPLIGGAYNVLKVSTAHGQSRSRPGSPFKLNFVSLCKCRSIFTFSSCVIQDLLRWRWALGVWVWSSGEATGHWRRGSWLWCENNCKTCTTCGSKINLQLRHPFGEFFYMFCQNMQRCEIYETKNFLCGKIQGFLTFDLDFFGGGIHGLLSVLFLTQKRNKEREAKKTAHSRLLSCCLFFTPPPPFPYVVKRYVPLWRGASCQARAGRKSVSLNNVIKNYFLNASLSFNNKFIQVSEDASVFAEICLIRPEKFRR